MRWKSKVLKIYLDKLNNTCWVLFKIFYLLILEGERREEEREQREIDLSFHLFMHSLFDSWILVCALMGMEPATLAYQELHGQDHAGFLK